MVQDKEESETSKETVESLYTVNGGLIGLNTPAEELVIPTIIGLDKVEL